MAELDDHQLLAQFARENSEAAFAALVERHVGLVYSVAHRSAGNAHAAEEITQAVFIILAKKADKMPQHAVLSGWLYQTTRLTAANFLRTEIRRQHREQEAYMQSLLNEPNATETWMRIAPLLDGALDKLGSRDRDAIALRFFENKSFAEVGQATGASEDAAKVRVNRALEKLRKIFTKRGVTLSALAIAGAVSTNSVQAAPVVLAQSVTAVAIVKGSIATASTLTLVKGTMKTMTWLKMKFAVGVGVATLLAGGVATVAVSQTSGGDKMTVVEIAKQSQAAYAALTSYSDSGTVVAIGGGQTTETSFTIRLQRPNLYRIDWAQTGGAFVSKGIVWSQGNGDYLVMDATDKTATPSKMQSRDFALGVAAGVSSSASTSIPGTFFAAKTVGNTLPLMVAGKTETKKLADEKIGSADCHVVVSVLDAAKLLANVKLPTNTAVRMKNLGITTTTLWIGKRDHLIHQVKTETAGMAIAMTFTDAQLKVQLQRRNKPVTPESLAALRTELEQSQAQANKSGFIFTETHENIVLNQKLSPSDFAR